VASRTGIAVVAGLVPPGFTLPRVGASEAVSLEALRGQVVLVDFWATWCKPCQDEMPSLQRLYQQRAGERFELLAVSIDSERAPIEDFQSRLGLGFPRLHDPDRAVADAWQASRFPESFLVDADGTVLER
jgi:thiol-disulfide isomerase/thioredoxin